MFLDDHPFMITEQVRLLQAYGFDAHVFSGLMAFSEAIEGLDSTFGNLKAIILDSHIPSDRDFPPLGGVVSLRPDGYGAGQAIARQYLSTFDRLNGVPIVILTAFASEPNISGGAESETQVLNKADPYAFENFVRSIVLDRTELPDFRLMSVVRIIDKHRDGASIALLQPAYDAITKAMIENPSLIYEIEPRQWEEIIAASYDRSGFDEVVLTPRSGDLGRDVIAIKKGYGSVKFIEQIKAYSPGHVVTADEVRALAGVLSLEQDVSKAIFTTTSQFAPRLSQDRLIKPLIPTRLELVDKRTLLDRLSWKLIGGGER